MAKVIKLSATRISTFLRCRKRYWYQYVDRMPKLSNPAFKLGIACHEALEMAGNVWLEGGPGKEEFTKAEVKKILAEYLRVSVREGIETLDVHAEGRQLVLSRLKSFNLGKKLMSLELPFGFPNSKYPDLKTDQGIPLIGAIDKVIELDEDTLLIVDYKTSKTAPTPDQLKEDLQLSLYDLVGNILYPQYSRIVLCLDMLKSEPVFTYRTPQQRADFNDYLTEVHKQMSELKEEKQAVPSLNIFCPWCDYKEHCQSYKKACEKTDYEFLPMSKLSDDELVSEHQRITSTLKILETRKRELNMLIMEKIQRDGTDVTGAGAKLSIQQNSRTNYDPRVVVGNIPTEDLPGMISLNKKAVENYCSQNPALAKTIKDSAITNYTTPFIVNRKLKK
jgi:CRISPR/Cas system-associated exonuclease Cas4 (RecB family)